MIKNDVSQNNERENEKDVIFGRNSVAEAIKSGRPLDSVMVARGDRSGSIPKIVADAKKAGIVIKEVDPKKLDFVCGHNNHQGIAAFGKDAEEYIKGEENATSPCPQGGCWDRLREMDAKILLLGVTHTRNTYIHSVDEVMEIEDRFMDEPTLMHIVMPNGSMKDVQMYRHYNRAVKTDCFSDEFDKMKQAFYDLGAAKEVKFGDATCILCDAKKIFDVCYKLFSIDPQAVIERESIPQEWWME